ncbi:DUF1036 domain-containing protein [Terrarubrum flagellatum]|uniref:DUF1036 domain-containing protein n=1 Tax=Terrirubrum flagellatum TaxID=2895980 RepID=UPI003144F2B6
MKSSALFRALLWLPIAIGAATFGPSAKADLRLCNMTTSRVGVSLGFRDQQGWVTEGWWNISANACETLLKGELAARYYYIHALDYDRGGEWGGKSFMCTRDREFTIRGADNCLARGFDRTGFFEVDSGEQKSWTIQLLDPTRPPPAGPLPSGATPPPPAGVAPRLPASPLAPPTATPAPSASP